MSQLILIYVFNFKRHNIIKQYLALFGIVIQQRGGGLTSGRGGGGYSRIDIFLFRGRWDYNQGGLQAAVYSNPNLRRTHGMNACQMHIILIQTLQIKWKE